MEISGQFFSGILVTSSNDGGAGFRRIGEIVTVLSSQLPQPAFDCNSAGVASIPTRCKKSGISFSFHADLVLSNLWKSAN
jgi:hypothetical protein